MTKETGTLPMTYFQFIQMNIFSLGLTGVRDGVLIYAGTYLAGFFLGFWGVGLEVGAVAGNVLGILIFAPTLIAFRTIKETTIYLPVLILVFWLIGLTNISLGHTDFENWAWSVVFILINCFVCWVLALPIRILLKRWIASQQTY